MAEVIALAIAPVKFAFEGIQSLARGLIPYRDQVGPRSELDRFQESTYGKAIPIIYGQKNRIAGNIINYNGISETRHQIKHTNGTFGSSTYTRWYTYSSNPLSIAIGGPISNITRIWANGHTIAAWPGSSAIPDAGVQRDGFWLFRGSDTQNRSPYVPSTLPAYRGISYVSFPVIQLSERFGNAIPNFEFEVDGGAATVGSIIADVCARSGMDSDDFEIDPSLYSAVIDGYVVSRQTSAVEMIKPLQEIYSFDIVETPSKVLFTSRAQTVKFTIDRGSLGARSARSTGEVGFESSRHSAFDAPRDAAVTYIDADRSYDKNTQIAGRSSGLSTSSISKDIAITMTADLARRAADRMIWEPEIERLKSTIRADMSYDGALPGNYIGLRVGDAWVNFRIDRKTMGANGIIEMDVTSSDPSIYDGATIGEGAEVLPNEPPDDPVLDVYLFNAPFIDSAGSDPSASWVASSGNNAWQGGALYRSTDGGATFYESGVAADQGILGTVTNALGTANPLFWDRVNTITVEMDYDLHELITLQEISVMNGLNWAWIGRADGSVGEIVGFSVATLISSSPRIYELSNLLRGRRATEYAIAGHLVGDRFVLLSDEIIQTINYGYPDIGREWIYKSVPAYSSEIEIVDTFNFTNTGERAKPRSPVHGRGERDDSNNLTIKWERRTRLFPPGIGYGPVPLDEDSEAYEIDIYNAAFTTVVRTISTSSKTASYTAAQQTADGLTPGDPVNIRIYQLSANVGRGHAGEFTV